MSMNIQTAEMGLGELFKKKRIRMTSKERGGKGVGRQMWEVPGPEGPEQVEGGEGI